MIRSGPTPDQMNQNFYGYLDPLILIIIMIIILREKQRGREGGSRQREGKKHRMCPNWALNRQPKHVP